MTTTATHPAKFTDGILAEARKLLDDERVRLGRGVSALDPFAGTGRVHQLAQPDRVLTIAVEIEPEWADQHPDTVCADALPWLADRPALFDVVFTSPCYGNRLADHHEARDASTRHSYTHDLGRPLTPGSSGAMHYGPDYWAFHARAYRLIWDALKPGGLFLLNAKSFVRRRAVVDAVEWHRGAAYGVGFEQDGRDRLVRCPGLRYGANRERVEHEAILRLRKGGRP